MTFRYKFVAGSYEEHYEVTLEHTLEFTEEEFEQMVEAAEVAVVKVLRPKWEKYRAEYEAACIAENPNWEATDVFGRGPSDEYGRIFDDIVTHLIDTNGFTKPKPHTIVRRGAWDIVEEVVTCPNCGKERLRGERFDSGHPRKGLPHICK